VINGKFKGEDVLLPHIPMIPTDVSFELRSQFSVRLAFAMTIYKAQGHHAFYMLSSCFLHGQLYVACSRVGTPSDLFVYTPEEKTKNIVYSKALQ
jgi:ATP-dependent DNA helicase PIF1